ncbi:MAG: DUF2124 family protein [Methanobacterium sp.]|nr:DUF2124 family protein [Methanobacterium sp.]
MDKKMGIVGLTGSFRESLSDIENESKIVFVGSVAVCTPFVELLSYSVRDKNYKLVYVPKSEKESAKNVKMQQGIGFSVVDEKADPKNPDAIVILGGLAMPKFGCAPEDVLEMIQEISGEKKPKVIGVCFMNIFENAGWEEKIPFDILMDTTLETVIK